MDDSAITCDKVEKSYDEEIKAIPTSCHEKNITCTTHNFCISLAFLLTTITLLIAVSIYCYLIKYQAKHLLPFHNTNNKLSKFCINSINRKRVIMFKI